METAEINKGGETRIRTILHRTAAGLSITIWAVPEVEEFMRRVGNGETVAVSSIGRHWVSPTGEALYAYAMPLLSELLHTDEGAPITLDRLGCPLLENITGGKYETINLSFLRLRGISDGQGVTFGVRGVYSLGHLRKLLDRINGATRKFYVDYMRPMDLSSSLTVDKGIPAMGMQELRL